MKNMHKKVLRLIQCKGARTYVRAKCVEPVAASVNEGDVFLLDDGSRRLFTWLGK